MSKAQSHLAIRVSDTTTRIEYVVDDNVVVSHTHGIGYKNIEADGMSVTAKSKLLDGILYTLEFVSLHDRIPTHFKLIAPRYSTWIGEVIEGASYTQFFTDGAPINVTLEGTTDVPLSYARHSKTIHSFKL